ncbi:MAG: MBL fold metallo-hydrolase [Acidobacteriota bacterium]|nr:MBL fold metallo-hydrolase [Acidobacteriota bacterium]
MIKVKFLGAASQVTGSCYHLSSNGLNFLVDCGLYQEREFLGRNWQPFPLPPDKIDYLLLTHAHLDHSGLIPKLVKEGFRGKIFCTRPTAELLPIVLYDTAKLQEEDAEIKRKRHQREGRTGPHPEVPLYTSLEVDRALSLVEAIDYHQEIALNSDLKVIFHEAGHIIGSSMVEILAGGNNGDPHRLVYSGDLGQWKKPLVRDPETFQEADYVFLESTYGDRDHEEASEIPERLAQIINQTLSRKGNLVIPTFAIERAQELMYHLNNLVRKRKIPAIPVFLDSPMAVNVTDVFKHHLDCLDADARHLFASGQNPFEFPGLKLVRDFRDSQAIAKMKAPSIIMAGSGMCTGGRIKQHLVNNISRRESTILFVGYQAEGTLGRQILNGQSSVRIYGQNYQVKALIEQIQGFSAHADHKQLNKWLSYLNQPPDRLFLVHGEKEVIENFSRELREKTGWVIETPVYLGEASLG